MGKWPAYLDGRVTALRDKALAASIQSESKAHQAAAQSDQTSKSTVNQKCIQCGQQFDARMYGCPHCGSQNGFVAASDGTEVLQIMAQKQESAKVNDNAVRLCQQGRLGGGHCDDARSHRNQPDARASRSYLGYALTSKGDFQEAVRVLEQVLSFNPHREEAKRYLATAKSKLAQAPTPRPKPSQSDARASTQPPRKGKWWQFWEMNETPIRSGGYDHAA